MQTLMLPPVCLQHAHQLPVLCLCLWFLSKVQIKDFDYVVTPDLLLRAIIRSCDVNLSGCCPIYNIITNMLLFLHSPILSASDLSNVQKQEQQLVFAVDQTLDQNNS